MHSIKVSSISIYLEGKSNLKITFSSGFNADGNNAIIDRMAERPNKKHYGPK